MRAPKVVVCDIDETLVVKHSRLTPRAKRAINALKKHGVYFGVASGRPIWELSPLVDRWNIDLDLSIAMNGNQLHDGITNEDYSYFMMEPEWIKETIELLKGFDCNPSVSLRGQTIVGHYDEFVEKSEEYLGVKSIVCQSDDLHELYSEPNYKIMFRTNPKEMPKIEAQVKAHPSKYYKGFKTGPMMMEFSNINGSKGYALEQFCKIHNIDIQDAWAFGDTSNDNEMLSSAGVGVCMANGSDDTKALANMITEYPCDEDGWARFIEDHILKPMGWFEEAPLENIKAVVCDIDNTLVAHHQDMTERTKNVIQTLSDHNVLFGVASGRPLNELQPLLEKWSDVPLDIIIGLNGCVLKDCLTDKIYEYFPMDGMAIQETIKEMKQFNGNPLVTINGETWVGEYDEKVKFAEKYVGYKAHVCQSEDYHELWTQGTVYKVLYHVEPEKMPEIEAYFKARPSLMYKGFKTQPMAFEFADPRGSKGFAMDQFCQMHDIDLEDVWAFGDTSNDNELLSDAGHSVCLLNGTDDTKAFATYITEKTVQEDGFANFVENHILKPLGWM